MNGMCGTRKSILQVIMVLWVATAGLVCPVKGEDLRGTLASPWWKASEADDTGAADPDSITSASTATPLPLKLVNKTALGDDQLFVAVVGTQAGNKVWVDCKTGALVPMTAADNTVAGPGGTGLFANCFTRLSDIASSTIAMPAMDSGRVYVSFKSPLFMVFATTGHSSPQLDKPGDPNNGIAYEEVDFGWNNQGLHASTSRTEAFRYPMGIEVWGSNNQYMKRGEMQDYHELLEAYQRDVKNEFGGCYQASSGIIFNPSRNTNFATNGAHATYFATYIDSIWSAYSRGQDIPGTIEAENYDNGGENIAYHDATKGNSGDGYRTDDVDIMAVPGGYAVGSIAEGEWLEYTLDTVAPGTYSIAVKTSGTSSPGSKVTLNIDGTMLGSITIPGTGNGQTWEQVILGGVPIAGGKTQVLRVAMNGSLFNIDNITFTRSSSGTITAKAGANQTITDTDKNGSQAVTLDGSGSTATGTSIASYTWKEGSVELATGAKPTVTLTVGIHIVTLTIASSEGFSTSDTVTIEVKAASTATGRYFMSESTLVTINKPSNVDFRTVMNSNGYIFPKAFDESTITALNTWANQLLATNPFAGLASNQVPYINLSDNVNKDGSYAFITQEQMAYLFLISIFGPGTNPLNDGSIDGLSYTRKMNTTSNLFMFSAMCFLTQVMKSDDCKSTYIGIAFGGMTQEEGMDYIFNNNLLTKNMGPVNVGYFDESTIMVQDATNPMDPAWCRAETSYKTVDDFWALNKTTADLGGSFLSVDIPGQTVVDIGGAVYGGGVAAPGVHVANSQDETLPVFFPETIGWSFFKTVGTGNPNGSKISYNKGIMFFGVRRYVHGLNGSKRVLGPSAGNPLEPARELLTTKLSFELKGTTLQMYDHNMTFVASQMNGTDPSGNFWIKNRKLFTQGTWFGSNKWNNLLNQNQYGWSSPLADIGKWYGCFRPGAYNADLGDVFSKGIRRIGTFNWGAGVWWGDPQQYFLVTWLATSLLTNVTLDYYIFSTSIENEGVQTALLKGDMQTRAKTLNTNSINPGQHQAPSSPSKDVKDVYDILKPLSTATALEKIKAASFQDVFVFDGIQ